MTVFSYKTFQAEFEFGVYRYQTNYSPHELTTK